MLLPSKAVFKRSFIKQCHDDGLTEEGQVLARIQMLEKQADLASIINGLHAQYQLSQSPEFDPAHPDKFTPPASPLPVGLAMGVGAPFVGSAMLGVLGSKLKGNWLDEEDVKQQELIDELRRQTELSRQYHRMGGASPS